MGKQWLRTLSWIHKNPLEYLRRLEEKKYIEAHIVFAHKYVYYIYIAETTAIFTIFLVLYLLCGK